MWTNAGDNGNLFLALAMGVVCWLLMRRTARRVAKNRRDSAPCKSAPQVSTARAATAGLHPDVGRYEIELYEVARDLSAELESRSRVLHILIAQARTEADRLEALLAQSRDMAEK